MKRVWLLLLLLITVFTSSWAESVQDDYVIGAGDVLKISVYKHADLAVTSRVSADGSVQFPLVGSIMLSGLTVKGAIKEIQAQLMDGYLVDPQVTIFIEEYRSKKVMVIGHVVDPGVLELRGPTHLLEVLSMVGGLRENAGDTATITRIGAGDSKQQEIIQVDLKKLLETGDSALNIQVLDKDSVFIAKAGMFYVTGEVDKPDAYKFEEGSTVLKAISMSGGFTKLAAKNKIRIVRIVGGKEQVLENVSLQVEIKPGDVIVVPESYF